MFYRPSTRPNRNERVEKRATMGDVQGDIKRKVPTEMKTTRKQIKSLGELVDTINQGKSIRLEMLENVTIQSIDELAAQIKKENKPLKIVFVFNRL